MGISTVQNCHKVVNFKNIEEALAIDYAQKLKKQV